MTEVSGKQYAVGLKHARVYKLDSHGVPDATGTSATAPYEGLQIVGAKAFELTVPDARRIAHTGDDKILMQDVLPRQEVSSGVLRSGRNDHDVFALLTDTKAAKIGEASVIGYGTSEQGNEPSIGVLLYQQSKDAALATRRWRSYILPSTQAIIKPSSMNSEVPEFEFDLLPSPSNYHLWGLAFADAVEGFTSTELVEAMTEGHPHIVSWLANGTATEFNFHTDRPATATGKIHAVVTVAADGTRTDVTATITKAVDGITFSVAPASGVTVVCFYEY